MTTATDGVPPAHFEAAYAGAPPWDIGRPQPDLASLELAGTVLDVGCGTGEHALHFAARGCEVLGVDAVPAAIERAQAKARARGLAGAEDDGSRGLGLRHPPARFEVGDALDLGALGQRFDHVIDCGLFHVFGDVDRKRYVDSLAAAVKPGGTVHLHCFSERTPGPGGPRRVTQPELHAAFSDGWRVRAISPTTYQTIWDDPQPRAWLARIERRRSTQRIAVFGASGRVGAMVLQQAIAAGHIVRAVVREGAQVEVGDAELVRVPALTPELVAAAVAGVDAVISAVGGRGIEAPSTVVTDATRTLIDAMTSAGVSRLITVGAAGLLPAEDGRLRGEVALPPHLRHPFADHRGALALLQASPLAWTIVCPPGIPEGPATSRYRAATESFPDGGQTLATGDVADALLWALHREDLYGRRVGVAY